MSKNRCTSRLRGYDYSRAGIYFVTICAQNRRCIFGEILNGGMRLNNTGKIVAGEWEKSAKIRDEIELDEWVVMPNHVHGIVWIQKGDIDPVHDHCRGDRPRPCGATSSVVRRIDCWVQIGGDKTNQSNASNPRGKIMATKLLGAYYP